jgi:hypothetical protein
MKAGALTSLQLMARLFQLSAPGSGERWTGQSWNGIAPEVKLGNGGAALAHLDEPTNVR